jgi:hypothetical protein
MRAFLLGVLVLTSVAAVDLYPAHADPSSIFLWRPRVIQRFPGLSIGPYQVSGPARIQIPTSLDIASLLPHQPIVDLTARGDEIYVSFTAADGGTLGTFTFPNAASPGLFLPSPLIGRIRQASETRFDLRDIQGTSFGQFEIDSKDQVRFNIKGILEIVLISGPRLGLLWPPNGLISPGLG